MIEKWNPRNLPGFKEGLKLLLKYKSEFSKHYLNVLNRCLSTFDRETCTKGDTKHIVKGYEDDVGYEFDDYSYIKDKHNVKKFNRIKTELKSNIGEKKPVFRAISTCDYDDLKNDLEKYGKGKKVISREVKNREEYIDVGKYWSWDLKNAFPHWGPEKCYGKQKEPIHAILTAKILFPSSIDLPETFSSNMLFGSDEEEITLKEGEVIEIEKICAFPQRYKGAKLEKPSRCKIINKKMRV